MDADQLVEYSWKMVQEYFIIIFLFNHFYHMGWNTAERGSNLSMFLQITHPARKRLATPPGYTLLLYLNSGVISFTSLKNQIDDGAVRQDLQFFILVRED